MSVWEFSAAVGGFVKANSAEDDTGISAEQADSLAAWIDEPPVWH